MEITSDYLVIGSGISGLCFALKAAEYGSVSLITKKEIDNTNTRQAQGGIAAVWDVEDSVELHYQDTLVAGDGLCNREVVKNIVQEGSILVRELMDKYNIEFDSENGNISLGLEGAHSKRRVLHCKDTTGLEIQQKLVKATRNHPNINIFEYNMAVNLFVENNRCLGAYVLDTKTLVINNFVASITVLATGGAGKVFLYTSNPDVASGDGVALGYRAGAEIMNMELIQFHPTCLYHPYAKSFLITEAMRGEGAILVNGQGERFMEKYHELKELAPRDIVARSIDQELKRSGDDHVFLDIRHRGNSFIKKRFPGIYNKCLSFGVDITTELIPVVPAAHYSIGGIKATTSGVTNINNLLAIGEVSCTGFHGANRLASNSLLEGLVTANQASIYSKSAIEENKKIKSFPFWDYGTAIEDSNERVLIAQNWDEIRRLMWNYVGIVRSNKRLDRALKRIDLITHEINLYYWNFIITPDLLELRNLAQVAYLIIRSAMRRKESRGVHFSLDYPNKLLLSKDTTLQF